jgi:hypothetical protein
MRRIRSAVVLLLISVAAAYAQAGTGTTNSNPASVIWAIVAIIGAMASGFFALSLIWTSIQGAIADHDHFQKLPRIVFWAAICFSATTLAVLMAKTA